ncbi:rhodanese-like domain-containing protein [Lactococcus lactis subsp. lactis]
MQTIDISELELLTESENPVIVDVREDFEYNSGHVPNAKNIPLSQLEERYAEITDGTYLICQSGARSARASQYLSTKGIDTINISGGTIAWNGPLEFTDRL